jgi:hypothetical protein
MPRAGDEGLMKKKEKLASGTALKNPLQNQRKDAECLIAVVAV